MGSMEEDGEGRAVVSCRILLSPQSLPPPVFLIVEEVAEETFVAAVDIERLHRSLGLIPL